ncbi:50S ribosomal protein L32 [candidate division GN15 bacterium]|jgi:large subunit ribosomal protein L32|nr:50S ribosomal protein L32 [candidate division GN15 bacterium]
MALPKRRHSRTRGRKRRTNWKVSLPNVSECPQCHSPKLPHHICPSCGYYKGRKVIDTQEV